MNKQLMDSSGTQPSTLNGVVGVLDVTERPQGDVCSFPLSCAQERIWVSEQITPGFPTYNMAGTATLSGPLKTEFVKKAFVEIVRRHEILRTSFAQLDGRPVQRIHTEVPLNYTEIDLSGDYSGRAAEKQVAVRTDQEAKLPFDLSQAGLLKVRLFRLEPLKHVLLMVMHHIICDGWSVGVLLRELKLLYDAYEHGDGSTLAELPIQYVDYSAWQRDLLSSGVLNDSLEFWKRELAQAPSALELPFERPRKSAPAACGEIVTFSIGPQVTGALRRLANQEGVTLYTVLLATFYTLVFRYTGQNDIVLGAPVSERLQVETEELIGIFVNLLPLRLKISSRETFATLLKTLKEKLTIARTHQSVPFDRIVEEAIQERTTESPLVQVVFAWQTGLFGPAQLGQAQGMCRPVETGTAKFDLTLTMGEQGDEIEGWIEYRSGLFHRDSITRMADHFLNLMESAADAPEARLSGLNYMSANETDQVASWAAQSEHSRALRPSVLEMFAEHVRQTPEITAIECAGERLSYAELDRSARQLAVCLERVGVRQDDVVALCFGRTPQMIVSMLAALKAGAAYLPLDPAYPQERLKFMLDDAKARALCTDNALLTQALNHAPTILLPAAVQNELGDAVREHPYLGPDNQAYVIYTSGSTGRPKGVQVTHRGLSSLCDWHIRAFHLHRGDRVAQVASTGFDASVWEIWSCLAAGATLCIVPEDVRLSPAALRDWLLSENITVTFLPTPLAERVIALDWPTSSPLRTLLTGGDRLRHAPECPLPFDLVNNYGPTECAVVATSGVVEYKESGSEAPPIGRPVSHASGHVLDSEMRRVGVGIIGELYVGGEGVARGYLHNPGLTAERFVPDPFSAKPGARLYRTGDLVRYRTDGQLDFLGRADDQVKLRGHRIEPQEVSAILRKAPGVRDALVMVRGGDKEGGAPRLVAYVVPRPAKHLSTGELKQHARTTLPEYMVPSSFVLLSQFPLSANGKVDRKSLPDPESEADAEQSDVLTPTEELIAGIWQGLLKLGRAHRNDNFFELGGHSLLIGQMVLRVRQILAAEIPMRLIFDFPVLRDFASRVELLAGRNGSVEQLSIPLLLDRRTAPLSLAQERLWFLDRFTSSSHAYNIAGALRLKGKLDRDAMRQSLQEIILRHEVLRTSFIETELGPVQQIHTHAPVNLEERDLREPGAKAATDTTIIDCLREEASRRLRLDEKSLFRAGLFQITDQEYVLCIVMHHLVGDGWSIGVLLQELKDLYRAKCQGLRAKLPGLAVQYADYAAWQREILERGGMDQGIEHWKKQLAGLQTFELPTDLPRSSEPCYAGGIVRVTLSPTLSAELRKLSISEGVTLYMVLLAGFTALLYRYTNQTDITLGSDVANRNHIGTEGLIGLFVNQVVVRTHVTADATLREVIARVRDVLLAAYAHQDVPFGKIVELLQPRRDWSRNPLFQIMVIFHNTPVPPQILGDLIAEPIEIDNGTAVFDLSLAFVVGQHDEIRISLRHTALFKTSTAERILHDLTLVLQRMADKPELHLGELEVFKMEDTRVQCKNATGEKSRFNRLMSVKAKPAAISPNALVSSDFLYPNTRLPVVFQPAVRDLDGCAWVREHRQEILEKLAKAGAVLFRGFDIDTVAQFQAFTRSLCPTLIEYGERSSPRTKVDDGVYTSTDHPADQPILLHNEQSYTLHWPMKILFGCLQPSLTGGCTPIADSRKILRRLRPQTVEKFRSLQIMYMRNYGDGLGLHWSEVFQTRDKSEVERYCRESAIEFEWKPNDRLRTRQVRPAVRTHPETGEESWFNHMLFFHITSLPPNVRDAMLSGLSEEEFPFNTFYGDGSTIEPEVLDEVREAYANETLAFPWQKGDLLMADNMLVAHGRQPYTGPRKIMVAMAEPCSSEPRAAGIGR